MKSAILSVGTELLFGQITNTNSVYLSQQLNLLGIDVMYHYTVGDNPERLAEMIHQAFTDCDLIITTGGLGPTQDDLTKEIAAEVLHDELVLHEPTLREIESFFKKVNREMTENNKKQAYIPSRAVMFHNDAGTAPGFALEENGKTIICLPGPPREMTRLFDLQVKPFLEKKSQSVIYYKQLRTFGIGESALETELQEYIDGQTDPTLATYAKEGEACLRIASKRRTLEEAKAAVEEMIEKVNKKVGQFVYSYDDENLYEVVGKKLMEHKISISSAESCTGGLFAQTLTEVPGISAVFDRGFITYSNQAKIEELGVKPETLEKFGAVSEETAVEMAEGLKKVTKSRLCISVTGIAGPDGGTEEKPVGLVYICAILDEVKVSREFRIRNTSRKWNRNYTLLCMLNIVNKLLDENLSS
ncbi:competence/damage-inducible protein A [Sinanaerobacter chloroacetimidivorans]|uniref:Putative competence-damage inducible protein n=1 Tax=Sinanaerobacter chloroacetimidivorans TaxID=2818044 RepID=A0A8J8B0E8_9FIRM|nr:competence/damage-inducible protein A [Sinanaerobacter chloroacetimidivorans]MBR0596546.1 competence/damage-inducible protein A [Sinanaerobacter chloroacetimidivorans]